MLETFPTHSVVLSLRRQRFSGPKDRSTVVRKPNARPVSLGLVIATGKDDAWFPSPGHDQFDVSDLTQIPQNHWNLKFEML
jgi:hypothetical protein